MFPKMRRARKYSARVGVQCKRALIDVEGDPSCLCKPGLIRLILGVCTQALRVHTRPLFFLHNWAMPRLTLTLHHQERISCDDAFFGHTISIHD